MVDTSKTSGKESMASIKGSTKSNDDKVLFQVQQHFVDDY